MEKPYICPICNSHYTKDSGVILHIKRMKDEAHTQYLEKVYKLEDMVKLILKKKDLAEIENIKKEVGCVLSDKKCFNCENTDCYYMEHKIYIKIQEVGVKKGSDNKMYKVSASELVKEFYALVGSHSSHFSADVGRVNRVLKYGVSPSVIRYTFTLLEQRGDRDLNRFSTYAIEQAVKYYKCLEALKKTDSLPSLVVKFYKDQHMEYDTTQLVNNTQRLIDIRKSYNITNKEVKAIIEYAIDKKTDNFNFINNLVPAALKFYKEHENEKQQAKRAASKDYYSKAALDDLIACNTTYNEVINMYGENYDKDTTYYDQVINVLRNQGYLNKYTDNPMKWLKDIDFPIDKKVIDIINEILL